MPTRSTPSASSTSPALGAGAPPAGVLDHQFGPCRLAAIRRRAALGRRLRPVTVQLDGRRVRAGRVAVRTAAVRASGTLRVRVQGPDGWTDWSAEQPVFASFLGADEWAAEFIGLHAPEARRPSGTAAARVRRGGRAGPGHLVRHRTGRLPAAEVNGTAVDDQVLKPGWTPYQYRLIHETTDVTELLRAGANALGRDPGRRLVHRELRLPGPGRAVLRHPAVVRRPAAAGVRRRQLRVGPQRRELAGHRRPVR